MSTQVRQMAGGRKPVQREEIDDEENRARSVRIDGPVYAKARRRAREEGVTWSYVIQVLTEGYAEGLIDLPQVEIKYSQPRSAAS